MTEATYPVNSETSAPRADPHRALTLDRLRGAFKADMLGLAFALVVGAGAAWYERFLVGADGMSYLDYSDRFLDGTWWAQPNGYWSPGYPILVAIIRSILGTGPRFDAPALHIAGFLGYVTGALGCAWLIRMLRLPRSGEFDGDDRWGTATSIALPVLVWGLFVWAAADLSSPSRSTPDVWVAGTTFLAAAAAIAVTRRGTVFDAVMLGIALGAGYLFKAVMFPIGVVLIATLFIVELAKHRRVTNVVVAAVVFGAIASPQVVLVSRMKGGLTIGQVGVLVHEWYVNDLPCPLFGESSSGDAWDTCMLPKAPDEVIAPQPFRRLSTNPSVYVFPQPANVTFPAWYDATRWYHNVKATIHLKSQIVAFVKNAGADWILFAPFLAGAGALMLAFSGVPARWRDVEWVLLVPSLATFSMYAASYSATRYLGPAIALTIIALAPLAWEPRQGGGRRTFFGYAFVAPTLLMVIAFIVPLLDGLWYDRHTTNKAYSVAAGLAQAGLTPGSKVGIIGDGSSAYWARLDRVHIIAEIHPAERNRFWINTPGAQAAILDNFRSAGVTAVVGDPAPAGAELPTGWTRVAAEKPLALYKF